jgi:hypothetical protein
MQSNRGWETVQANLVSSRLLKNKFREGQASNILYASLLDYTFGSASLVASARFSAACYPPICAMANGTWAESTFKSLCCEGFFHMI